MNTPYILKNHTFPTVSETVIIDLSEIAFLHRTTKGIPVLEVCFKGGLVKEIIYDNPGDLAEDFGKITEMFKNKTQCNARPFHPVDERSIEPPEDPSEPAVFLAVD